MNTVEKFQTIKKQLSLTSLTGLKEYDASLLLANDVAVFLGAGIRQGSFFKMFLPFLLKEYSYDFSNLSKGCILFFNSQSYRFRKDYMAAADRFRSIIDHVAVVDERVSSGVPIDFHAFADIWLILIWGFQLRHVQLPVSGKFFLIKQLGRCFKLHRDLCKNRRMISEAKALVTQFDALDSENLFAQFCRRLLIPTVTLEHGHFHATCCKDGKASVIGTPFEGLASDFFFAWGEYAKLEAISNGISPDRIKCVGSLKIKGMQLPVTPKDKAEGFSVILNGVYGAQDNAVLLATAEKIGERFQISFIVRPHPFLGIDKAILEKYSHFLRISPQEESIADLVSASSFSICGNSTVLSELLFYRQPVFELQPVDTVDYYERFTGLKFSNDSDLSILLEQMFQAPEQEDGLIEKYRKMLFFTDHADEAYQKAISEII